MTTQTEDPNRYSAHTLDGSVIYRAPDAQRISDAAIDHIKAGRGPHIAYTFDNRPGTVWPYTTWRRAPIGAMWIGTPWKTFDEVCLEVCPRASFGV